MYKLFGIPNCNTVKNARNYLDAEKISYEFINFKKYTPTDSDIRNWAKVFGGRPINKAGLTYRRHKEKYESLSDEGKVKFIQTNPSIIKRPILLKHATIVAFGFDEEKYSELI